MAYKLIATAESRWRGVNAPHFVALVRAGALFHNGVLVERSERWRVNSVRNDTERWRVPSADSLQAFWAPAPLLAGLPSAAWRRRSQAPREPIVASPTPSTSADV